MVEVPYRLVGDSIFFKEHPQMHSGKEPLEYKGQFRVENDRLIVNGSYNGDLFYGISGDYIRMEEHEKRIRMKYKTRENYSKESKKAYENSGR